MLFEWDNRKAAHNVRKQGVSFEEAATIFDDPWALTFDDPDHSFEEQRFVTLGESSHQRVLFVAHTDRMIPSGLPAPVRRHRMRGGIMKTHDEPDFTDELRPEYDLSQLQGRVQGKYTERYRAGTNIVRLAPDVAAVFPNEEAVNEALRLLIQVAKAHVPQA